MVSNVTVRPAHPDSGVLREQKVEQRRSLATPRSLDLETSFESLSGLWPWLREGTKRPGRAPDLTEVTQSRAAPKCRREGGRQARQPLRSCLIWAQQCLLMLLLGFSGPGAQTSET